ncbi:MAG: EpsG family protein [Clostridia bacterium]|nr:EpsG family protein [Clostridia bacterium]
MTVYLAFISITIVSPILLQSIFEDRKKANLCALIISALFLFLMLALRAPSVGRDVIGYKNMYEQFAKNTRYDADTYWVEKGYSMIQMFFARVLKADWQVFLAFCSGFSVFSYFLFLKRYSSDPAFSLLVYILMGYMMFDMSAMRTALALSICLLILPLFDKKGIWPPMIVTIIVIFIAIQFHSSAYIFYLLYLLYKTPLNSVSVFCFISLPMFFFAFRGPIVDWAIGNFKKSAIDGGASLGGNALLYIFILIFAVIVFVFLAYQNGTSFKSIVRIDPQTKKRKHFKDVFADIDSSTIMAFRMLYAGVAFTIFTGNNIFARMAEYGLIFTVILLPNLISKFEIRSRYILKIGLIGLMMLYFYYYKVIPDDLWCVPYKFFWDA